MSLQHGVAALGKFGKALLWRVLIPVFGEEMVVSKVDQDARVAAVRRQKAPPAGGNAR
jgi:hypothetical protein